MIHFYIKNDTFHKIRYYTSMSDLRLVVQYLIPTIRRIDPLPAPPCRGRVECFAACILFFFSHVLKFRLLKLVGRAERSDSIVITPSLTGRAGVGLLPPHDCVQRRAKRIAYVRMEWFIVQYPPPGDDRGL